MNDVYNDLFGNFINKTFSEIYGNETDFINDYKATPLYAENHRLSDENIRILYYLLYARYGNSVIASYDENQFKFKLFSTIFMYGPTWEKRLEIQAGIRKLSVEDGSLLEGAKYISNLSYNPSTPPNNGDLAPLDTVNQQSYNGWKKNKLQAYGEILEILRIDITESFIGQFKKLFIKIVQPNAPLWYITDKEDPTYD